jgi:hypothetical protein
MPGLACKLHLHISEDAQFYNREVDWEIGQPREAMPRLLFRGKAKLPVSIL